MEMIPNFKESRLLAMKQMQNSREKFDFYGVAMRLRRETACFYQEGVALVGHRTVVIISLVNSRLRVKLCYFMILILSVFDLAVSAVFHPFILLETLCIGPLQKEDICFIEPFHLLVLIEHLFVFSLTALFTMTLERYLAIMHPFFHQAKVTKKRLIAIFMFLQLPFGLPYFAFAAKNVKDVDQKYLEPCILVLVVTFSLQ